MKTVYGPVASRRLGHSLGVDPLPLKTCNWNCVYCQLGRSTPLTNERREWISAELILSEVETALQFVTPGKVDWITFVGSGEPTLHSKLGWMIEQVKQMTTIPVGLITNGALFYRPDVRQEVLAADAILPTLSAGSAELHRTIHRHHGELTFERHLSGLVALRDAYDGHLWLELMLVAGLNDSEAALHDIAAAVEQIRPDKVHITLPTRPPSETWVAMPDLDAILRAVAILGSVATVVEPNSDMVTLLDAGDLFDAVVGLVTRHPVHTAQLDAILETIGHGDPAQLKADLLATGRVQQVWRNGLLYWSSAPSHYPDAAQSERTRPVLT